MESVLAVGIIRTAATSIRNGADVDTALRQASQGSSKSVRELVLGHIQHAMSPSRKATPELVKDAILEADRVL